MKRIAMPSPNGTNFEGLFPTGKAAAAVRGGAAYDAAMEDGPSDKSALLDGDGSPIADSSQAHRILTACIDRLSTSDMDKVCAMLKDADLLSDDEVRSLSDSMSGNSGTGGEEMASDAAIMARRREHVRAGSMPESHLYAPIERPRTDDMAHDTHSCRR